MNDLITEIKTIAVLTSGGDSPGMNAAVRAVVRSAAAYNINVFAVYHGYQGLIEDEFEEMGSHSVSNIIQRGGTILKSARSMEFKTEEGRKKGCSKSKKTWNRCACNHRWRRYLYWW